MAESVVRTWVTIACMKPNAVPFLFLPGMVLAGYLLGRRSGVGWSLAVWSTAVLIGTVIHVVRRMYGARHHESRPRAARNSTSGPSEATTG